MVALAGAGYFYINEPLWVSRLAEDHANARLLADELAGVPGVAVNADGAGFSVYQRI